MSTKNTVTTKQVQNAVAKIGEFMTDNYTDQDGVIQNGLAWLQTALIGNMVWKTDQLIERTHTVTMPRAVDDLKRAHRANRGDEISLKQIEGRVNWIKRLEDQLLVLEAYREAVAAAYEDATGDSYTAGTKTSPAPVPGTESEAERLMAKYARKPYVRQDANSPAITDDHIKNVA